MELERSASRVEADQRARATASLTLSILWICWIGSILGLIFGMIALS